MTIIKRRIRLSIICIIFICIGNMDGYSWGFWAHRHINRMAVFTLPEEMIGFYKRHIDYITAHAIDPDKRRYASKNEAPRHYIDMDHYGQFPFSEVPRRWKDAVDLFTEDTLLAYGIVPWHVQKMQYWLTSAFLKKDKDQILRLSAEIGHYIADAHVPLHTTENYNGQLTNQKGIHGFWESRLPELFANDYDYFVGKAVYIDSPLEKIWEVVLESTIALDSVLLFEKELSQSFSSDKKYSFEVRGERTIKVYSKEFSTAYHVKLNGMVERRMRDALLCISSFWYTAWVDAGQPDLSPLIEQDLSQSEKDKIEKEEREWLKKSKIKGRAH